MCISSELIYIYVGVCVSVYIYNCMEQLKIDIYFKSLIFDENYFFFSKSKARHIFFDINKCELSKVFLMLHGVCVCE